MLNVPERDTVAVFEELMEALGVCEFDTESVRVKEPVIDGVRELDRDALNVPDDDKDPVTDNDID